MYTAFAYLLTYLLTFVSDLNIWTHRPINKYRSVFGLIKRDAFKFVSAIDLILDSLVCRPERCTLSTLTRSCYDTIRDAILTCARKPT